MNNGNLKQPVYVIAGLTTGKFIFGNGSGKLGEVFSLYLHDLFLLYIFVKP